ncbi:hypothetical protein HGRIS_001680 [Hohenbuehelia grisea]|uniref:NACHT domain-containing protein n=1 Tax=Hohenbuehelia grisea TaxID=104357 RepID=A0ABR3JJW3_9AGAR
MNDVHGDQKIYHAPVSNYHGDGLTTLQHVPTADIRAQSQEGCLPGTRVMVLDGLREWSRDQNAPHVYWLVGAAGAGKSAIARSFARWLNAEGILGGSFFCHRQTTNRADIKSIVRTLACFLSRQDPSYHSALISALQNPHLSDVANWTVDLQIDTLFVDLLGTASRSIRKDLVLIIDALDECGSPDETRALLTKLLSVSSVLPVKWFITSRPERHIREKFENQTSYANASLVFRLHDIEKEIVAEDITLYIRYHLDDIRRNHGARIPDDWPQSRDVGQLAESAGTLFIFAATAIKYIADDDPVTRLRKLTSSHSSVVPGRPLTGSIDDMYKFILADAFDPEKRDADEIALTRRAIATILTVYEPLLLSTIASLLYEPVERIRSCLDRVHAVILVPPKGDDIVTTFHVSFADFLGTSSRAPENMFLDLALAQGDLARQTLKIMNTELRFNISGCRFIANRRGIDI